MQSNSRHWRLVLELYAYWIYFLFFFQGHWQAVIVLPLAGTERNATPLMADKPPLFWQNWARRGWVFQLCPRGERIKLCGRAAWWRSEPVRVCYHVNPPSHDTTDLHWPHDSKSSTWPGRRELIRLSVSLWEQGCITFFAESKVWPTAQEGQFKDIYTVRLEASFVLWNSILYLLSSVDFACLSLYKV